MVFLTIFLIKLIQNYYIYNNNNFKIIIKTKHNFNIIIPSNL